MKSTPGTNSATPWSMYLFTTCQGGVFTKRIGQPDAPKMEKEMEKGSNKRKRERVKGRESCEEDKHTLLISARSFSVISVLRGRMSEPIIDIMSWPPYTAGRIEEE